MCRLGARKSLWGGGGGSLLRLNLHVLLVWPDSHIPTGCECITSTTPQRGAGALGKPHRSKRNATLFLSRLASDSARAGCWRTNSMDPVDDREEVRGRSRCSRAAPRAGRRRPPAPPARARAATERSKALDGHGVWRLLI